MEKKKLISNIIAITLLLAFSVLIEGGTTLPKIINLIFIYSIAALSLNVICGCLGEFVLGHGGFLLIGYTVFVLASTFLKDVIDPVFFRGSIYTVLGGKLHLLGYVIVILLVLICGIITGLIGLLVGAIALGRLKGDYLAIVTLGISLIFVNIAKNFKAIGGAAGIGSSSFLGGTPLLYAIFLVVVIFLIMSFMKSRFGRAILACRDDNIAAEASGVAVNKYKVLAFTFASFIAGIAGGLLANYTTYAPTTFGQDRSILFLIIIVLGGLGSLSGSIIASSLIVVYELWFCQQTWVPEFFTSNPKIIYGIILVLIMLFRSSGILGTAEFTWDWFYKKIKKIWGTIFNKKTPKEVE
jgi:branched-chain amino acid transport system permease protein